ncbi:MAG: biotin synthase BioB, partial [Candidatus Hydrogenedentes bacterium]|nr:biotin synthase BioB [Candidatus Hydrogenedentota bacterium]
EEELRAIYDLPLMELVFQAQTVHRQFHDPNKIQRCTLLSVKTGACPEDCSYCPQSAHHNTELEQEPLIDVEGALVAAKAAKESGSSRFCMGAAWREVRDGAQFDQVLEMVRGVKALGMEACCTLGMVTEDQAQRLAEAGLDAYNHNLDTGPDYYEKIISTRKYEDRLQTIQNVRKAGVTVCSGGIVGMGESVEDRIAMLAVLAGHDPHPESVPINALVAVEGTPLADQKSVDPLVMVRMIATARIAMPSSMVRLSAGRTAMSDETQALCFLAGANSIFAGDKLLTTENPGDDRDKALFDKLGLETLEVAGA